MRIHLAKRFLSVRSSHKPLYVTTPIFYVNAKPHLGHLYLMLLCDTRIRWDRLNPLHKSYFLTGTDEHGLKIQEVAAKHNVPCKRLVDTVSENFKALARDLNIEYDRFIRTTDPDHVATVQFFWRLMEEKGLIYRGSHSGWYSVSDETFYPETQTEIVTKDGVEKRVSKETRSEVVFQEETNYFFRLSQFQEPLVAFLEENPTWIHPRQKHAELLRELKGGPMSDLSISRPASRLTWGIDVPTDPSQKIYVWFDALLNYLTAAGFPKAFEQTPEGFTAPVENVWPAIHVIGKDIMRFHCIYWPIFLMAAGIQLPEQVIVHSHWLSEGFKMSKSIGNVVDPIATNEYYGQDAVRFFLAENSNIANDCNYSEAAFHATRDNLIGKYANLVTRIGGTAFDVRAAVEMYGGTRPEYVNFFDHENGVRSSCKELEGHLDCLHREMDNAFADFDTMRALQHWWGPIEHANSIFQAGAPWKLTKIIKDPSASDSERENARRAQLLLVYVVAETLRITSILAQPIIPNLAGKVLDRLGVSPQNRTADKCSFSGDRTYGAGANDPAHKMPIARVPMRTCK